MSTVVLSATQARNQFFDLINASYYGGQISVIKKGAKVVAKIVPVHESEEVDWKVFFKNMKKLSYLMTSDDYRDMAKSREDFNQKRFPDW